MKKGKRHATAPPRTGARLLQPKPNLERKKGTQQLRRARKVRNSAPSHACYDKAELRTRKRLSKRARLLQPKPNLERKKIRARLPPRQGRCAPAHRRTPAPTKAELRTKKGTQQPHRARKVRNSAPSHACYNQSRTKNEKRYASALTRSANGVIFFRPIGKRWGK